MGIGGGIVLLVLSLIFGRDFVSGARGGIQSSRPARQRRRRSRAGRAVARRSEGGAVRVVRARHGAGDVVRSCCREDMGTPWHDAKLVLFRNATQTGCGVGQTAMGPFYCPNDQKVYIDLAFYDELRDAVRRAGRFRAGVRADARARTSRAAPLGHRRAGASRAAGESRSKRTQLSVRLELQADCFAGVWAHATRAGEDSRTGRHRRGLTAAAAVGDDRIQRQTTGHVNTDTFTHGSSAQRAMWFKRGLRPRAIPRTATRSRNVIARGVAERFARRAHARAHARTSSLAIPRIGIHAHAGRLFSS